MYINKKQLRKIPFYFLIAVGFIFSNTSYADLNENSWTKNCRTNSEGQKVGCKIGINSLMSADSNGNQSVAAVIEVQKGITAKKKEKVVVFTAAVPLNVDLNKSPQIFVDENFIIKITYRYCNSEVGCMGSIFITEEIINKLKKGKNLNIIFFAHAVTKPYRIDFPLKNFTKAYKEL
jgi:invasion protein IalB